jgi:CDP-diacylglycerol--glycerol-3-phosphate 3-phosphatidyltransferase
VPAALVCHPWLAAGVISFIAIQLYRELSPVLRAPSTSAADASTGFLGVRVRAWFRGRIDPLAEAFLALGATPNGVTALQLVASVFCGWAYAGGWLFTAGWTLIASGTCDVIDGALARKRGATLPRGAFIDSVVDRYGEVAVFSGLAVLLRDSWGLWMALAACVGSMMVSYTRARAESLGVDCRVGLMQRPERFVVLGAASMFGSLGTHLTCDPGVGRGLLLGGLTIIAVFANLTAFQRAWFTLRRLR